MFTWNCFKNLGSAVTGNTHVIIFLPNAWMGFDSLIVFEICIHFLTKYKKIKKGHWNNIYPHNTETKWINQ